jgi:hypothetical protein
MTVAELQERLKEMNPTIKVILTVGDEENDIYSSSVIEVLEPTSDYVELFMPDTAPQQL